MNLENELEDIYSRIGSYNTLSMHISLFHDELKPLINKLDNSKLSKDSISRFELKLMKILLYTVPIYNVKKEKLAVEEFIYNVGIQLNSSFISSTLVPTIFRIIASPPTRSDSKSIVPGVPKYHIFRKVFLRWLTVGLKCEKELSPKTISEIYGIMKACVVAVNDLIDIPSNDHTNSNVSYSLIGKGLSEFLEKGRNSNVWSKDNSRVIFNSWSNFYTKAFEEIKGGQVKIGSEVVFINKSNKVRASSSRVGPLHRSIYSTLISIISSFGKVNLFNLLDSLASDLSGSIDLGSIQNKTEHLSKIVIFSASIKVWGNYRDRKEIEKLVKIFVNNIWFSSLPESMVSRTLIETFEPLIKSISHSHFENLILPILKKSFLRIPELAIHRSSWIIPYLSIDISKYFSILYECLFPYAKTENAALHKDSCILFTVICENTSDGDSLKKIAMRIIHSLDNKPENPVEKVSSVSQKFGLIEFLHQMSLSSGNHPLIVNEILDDVKGLMKNEKQEKLLNSLIFIYTSWCLRKIRSDPFICNKELLSEIISPLLSLLDSKSASTFQIVLKNLIFLFKSSPSSWQCLIGTETFKVILDLASDRAKSSNTNRRSEFILLFYILLLFFNNIGENKVNFSEKHVLWNLVIGPKSILFDKSWFSGNISSFDNELILSGIVSQILINHSDLVKNDKDFFMGTIHLLVCGIPHVQHILFGAFGSTIPNSMTKPLLSNVEDFLKKELSDSTILNNFNIGPFDSKNSILSLTLEPNSSVYFSIAGCLQSSTNSGIPNERLMEWYRKYCSLKKAILHSIGPGIATTEMSKILLLFHHIALVGKSPFFDWKRVIKCVRGDSTVIENYLSFDDSILLQSLKDILVDPQSGLVWTLASMEAWFSVIKETRSNIESFTTEAFKLINTLLSDIDMDIPTLEKLNDLIEFMDSPSYSSINSESNVKVRKELGKNKSKKKDNLKKKSPQSNDKYEIEIKNEKDIRKFHSNSLKAFYLIVGISRTIPEEFHIYLKPDLLKKIVERINHVLLYDSISDDVTQALSSTLMPTSVFKSQKMIQINSGKFLYNLYHPLVTKSSSLNDDEIVLTDIERFVNSKPKWNQLGFLAQNLINELFSFSKQISGGHYHQYTFNVLIWPLIQFIFKEGKNYVSDEIEFLALELLKIQVNSLIKHNSTKIPLEEIVILLIDVLSVNPSLSPIIVEIGSECIYSISPLETNNKISEFLEFIMESALYGKNTHSRKFSSKLLKIVLENYSSELIKIESFRTNILILSQYEEQKDGDNLLNTLGGISQYPSSFHVDLSKTLGTARNIETVFCISSALRTGLVEFTGEVPIVVNTLINLYLVRESDLAQKINSDIIVESKKSNTKSMFGDSNDEPTVKILQEIDSQELEEEKEKLRIVKFGIAKFFCDIAPLIPDSNLIQIFEFFSSHCFGIFEEEIRVLFLEASNKLIEFHGETNKLELRKLFKDLLDKFNDNNSEYDDEELEKQDIIHECIIICLGWLTKYATKDDKDFAVKDTLDLLLNALNTPSESVQKSVASSLPKLIQLCKEEAPSIIERLMSDMYEGSSFPIRRGASLGLAGVLRGVGISSLKKYSIIPSLLKNMESKNASSRQGSLFAVEALSLSFKRMFEAYIVQIMPVLLTKFSDSVVFVRESAEDASKAIMSQLSVHGVKLILPSLTEGLLSTSWKTRKNSVEALGSMTALAPKQLSKTLPELVPELIKVLGDSHPKVVKSAKLSIERVSTVIRNPEIITIVEGILNALFNPEKYTDKALELVLHTSFVNYIDPASLSMLMPIILRALKSRNSTGKKSASRILASIGLLTEEKDILPYLPQIVPELKKNLLDAQPKVRSLASKALGSLVKKFGEQKFEDVIDFLFRTMRSDSSTSERTGAAQGLSELIKALGIEKFSVFRSRIIDGLQDNQPFIREGFLSLFIYLPISLGVDFEPFVPEVMDWIFTAFCDDTESVREISLKAASSLIATYYKSCLELLLEFLENGINDDHWRVRQRSIVLFGDLFYRLGNDRYESDQLDHIHYHDIDYVSDKHAYKLIVSKIGKERFDRMLILIFISRGDLNLLVRQEAHSVWKNIVENSSKTLFSLMPIIVKECLVYLSQDNEDKHIAASETLGDLVTKMGDQVLPKLIPILDKELYSSDVHIRRGACTGLQSIVSSSSRVQFIEFLDLLLPSISKSIKDEDDLVRANAAKTFNLMYDHAGKVIVRVIVANFLKDLNSLKGIELELCLDGLQKVVSYQPDIIISEIMTDLISSPISVSRAKAIKQIGISGGDSIANYLNSIMEALIGEQIIASNEPDTSRYESLKSAALELLRNIDSEKYHVATSELQSLMNSKDKNIVLAGIDLTGLFLKSVGENLDIEVLSGLIRTIVSLSSSKDDSILSNSLFILKIAMGIIKKEESRQYISRVRIAIREVVSDVASHSIPPLDSTRDEVLVPGFCKPKGIAPLLPLFLNCLLLNSADARLQASDGLRELIKATSDTTFKPHVLQIIGPLIRVVGDRFSVTVKESMFETIVLIMKKGGKILKLFVPQLQIIFIKGLCEPSGHIRTSSLEGLDVVFSMSPKMDSILNELRNSLVTASQDTSENSSSYQETIMQAIKNCLEKFSKIPTQNNLTKMENIIFTLFRSTVESVRVRAGEVMSYLLKYGYKEDTDSRERILSKTCFSEEGQNQNDWHWRHSCSILFRNFLTLFSEESCSVNSEYYSRSISTLETYLNDEKIPIKEASVVSLGKMLEFQIDNDNLFEKLLEILSSDSQDIRYAGLIELVYICQKSQSFSSKHFLDLVAPVVSNIKSKNFMIRSTAETALFHVLNLKNDSNELVDKFMKVNGTDVWEGLPVLVDRIRQKSINEDIN